MIARSYCRRLPSSVAFDDLVQEGMIGLLKARANYVQQDNTAFRTYATHRIRGSISDYLRAMDHLSRASRRKVKHEEAVTWKWDWCMHDRCDAPDIELPGTKRRLLAAIETLSERQRYCVRRHFFDEITGVQISKELGVSEGRVSQLLHRACANLRKLIWLPS